MGGAILSTRGELKLRRRNTGSAGEGTQEFVRAITVLVGFDDTCDFICDGTADEVEINAAIAYVNALGGGIVHLKQGTYVCADVININVNYIVFEGEGYNTILQASTTINDLLAINNADNIIIRQLQIDGNSNAYTLLGVYATGGSTTEYISVSDVWLHDNKTGAARSILWVWDVAGAYNVKYVWFSRIYGWNMDTGASDQDNIAFSSVDTCVIENSYFSIERTFIFYYTRHACAYNVTVVCSEYATFVDDTNTDDSAYINCTSSGGLTRLFGTNITISGGYYEDGIAFGDSTADWYGGDILIEGAYITGAGPIALYGRRIVIEKCRILTETTHCIAFNTHNSTGCEYVLIDGNEIDNANLGVYCILVDESDVTIIENNDLLGSGGGISLDGAGHARIRNTRIGVTNPHLNILATFTGTLDLPYVHEQFVIPRDGATENTGDPSGIDINADGESAVAHITLPPEVQRVIRLWIWGTSNVIEAANNMLLQLAIQAGGSSEGFNAIGIFVANQPSEETGGIIVNDVLHWMIDTSDSAVIDQLRAGDYCHIYAIGEAAVAPDIATNARFGVALIEYI